jgi:hypothetical protein
MSNQIRIAEPIKSIVVAAATPFQYEAGYGFSANQAMTFSLDAGAPDWLVVDAKTGCLRGEPPELVIDHEQFLVTIQAQVGGASLEQSFFIKVVAADVIEHMTRFLLHLSHHPFEGDRTLHDILEFIFEYFMASRHQSSFIRILSRKAKGLGIKINFPISYKDFKKVAEALHPGIEKELQKKLHEYHLLAEAELTHEHMTRLFREGAQPLGAIPLPVWNYLGEASYHNWSELHTVLHAAVEAVKEMHQHAHVYELHHRLP